MQSLQVLVDQHEPQLQAMGVPDHLQATLLNKILKQVYDAGNFFR